MADKPINKKYEDVDDELKFKIYARNKNAKRSMKELAENNDLTVYTVKKIITDVQNRINNGENIKLPENDPESCRYW